MSATAMLIAGIIQVCAEVDRLHQIAPDVGWTAVSGPKLFPRFNDRYYASFVEDDNGIRLEFMHNPPHEPAA
jgi:hypothetical protein